MILWQKRGSVAWLATHEPQIEIIAGNHLAVISRPGRARSLVQVACPTRARAERLRRHFGGTTEVLPRDWLPRAQVKEHAPIRIGSRLEVVCQAPGAGRSRERKQLIIPAAGAFGTGEHATTAMSLRLLEEATRKLSPDWHLLDAGTGTGILALAARRLGAGEALGLDIDPQAVAHARQNARLNRIARVRFIVADIREWRPNERYDVIAANLFSELLIRALRRFRRALRPEGVLILSGILRDQAAEVSHHLQRVGFVSETRRRGRWVAFRAGRPPKK